MTSQDLTKIKLPDTPGVYFFKRTTPQSPPPLHEGRGSREQRGGDKEILYIGKATSLKDRVRSYFTGDLMASRGPKIVKMLEEATTVTVQETDSVLEALILESNLIKKHQPPYNTKEKDQKSYNYVVITDEDFPRVFTMRERELFGRHIIKRSGRHAELDSVSPVIKSGSKNHETLNRARLPARQVQGDNKSENFKHIFGPYPNGSQLRDALKIVRKIFPFRDKKSSQKKHEAFYRQLALTPDLSESSAKKTYAKTMRNIKLLFEGKKGTILKNLEREMKRLAKERKFEEADVIKKQFFALQHIQDISLIKDIAHSNSNSNSLRIEAYDIAHTSGTETVGVMTVIEGGEPVKSDYKKFKLRGEASERPDDTANLEEILRRRLGHFTWQLPDLIVIDGGKAQYNRAKKVLDELNFPIEIVAVTKDEKHRPKSFIGRQSKISQNERAILLANSEAHRFSLAYHRQRLRKRL